MAKDKNQQTRVIKNLGKKLGFLIGHSTLNDKIKLELVSLIERMKPEQIDRLTNVFEAKYADEATKNIDERFKRELCKIIEDYQNEQEKIDKKFIEHIKNLTE